LGLFLSHIFLGLGVFLAVFTLLFMGDRGRRGVDRAVVQAVIAALTALALYGLLWALTGFDPVATIRYIASRQAADLVKLARPYPLHLLFDPLDVALGTGYVSIPLVGFYLLGGGKPRITKMFRLFAQTPAERLTFLGLLQLLVLWAAAMLPGEGARLWLPFLPLLMAPIGFELTTWSFRARLAVYACLWLVTTVVCQNMIFLYLGPEIDGPR
jgi:hypothetical protein